MRVRILFFNIFIFAIGLFYLTGPFFFYNPDTDYSGSVFDPSPSKAKLKDRMLLPKIIQERKLFAYNENLEFTLLDQFPVPCESTPVVHGGKVFIASGDGYLYCPGEKI